MPKKPKQSTKPSGTEVLERIHAMIENLRGETAGIRLATAIRELSDNTQGLRSDVLRYRIEDHERRLQALERRNDEA